jgi:ketosteroid isomerase-like protein
MPSDTVTEPTVRAIIDAINAGDRDAFFALLTDDATLSDDGSERDLRDWVDREIFTANGHLDVETAADEGRSLIARYRNDTYGAMRTSWKFTVRDGQISRIEAGQA